MMTEDGLKVWSAMPRDERVRRCITRLRREFAEGFLRGTGCPWMGNAYRDLLLANIADWVVEMGGNPAHVIRRLLAGFFQNERAKTRAFPLSWLEHDPVEFYSLATEAPAVSVETAELLRVRAEREGRR